MTDRSSSLLSYAHSTASDPSLDWRSDPELGTAHLARVVSYDGRSLRKSCDRCHQQKLRCIGGRNRLTQCIRCQRAGAECVYSSRSNKQSRRTENDAKSSSVDGGRSPQSTEETSASGSSEMDSRFDVQLIDFEDMFDRPPSWDAASLANFAMAATPSEGVPGVSLGGTTRPLSKSGTLAAPQLDRATQLVQYDLLPGRLANISHTLEAIYLRGFKDQDTQMFFSCPISQTYAAFNSFLEVLALSEMKLALSTRKAQAPSDEFLRTKLALTVVHNYVLCMKLLTLISEKMLQALLASPKSPPQPPAPATAFAFVSQTTPPQTVVPGLQFSPSEAAGGQNDSWLRTTPFQHALSSRMEILDSGGVMLSKMEQLLGIPPEIGVGSLFLGDATQTDHADSGEQGGRVSLPARLVSSIWEEEASMGGRAFVTYFRRCRAAIQGLTSVHDHAL